jgi:hypothetical protein
MAEIKAMSAKPAGPKSIMAVSRLLFCRALSARLDYGGI